MLDYYGVPWEYEPRTFVLEEDDDGRVLEAFTPDFYLPEQDLYIEITVMKQSLVTRKNRKLRKLRARYPDVKIKLFYRRDIERLAQRFPPRPRQLTCIPWIDRIGEVYLSADGDRRARRASSAPRSPRDYDGREPLLVASLKASLVFAADLSRAHPDPARARLRRARRLRPSPTRAATADPPAQGSRPGDRAAATC